VILLLRAPETAAASSPVLGCVLIVAGLALLAWSWLRRR
jgi:hypothetical protein